MNNAGPGETGGLAPVVSYARTSEDFRRRDGHGVRYQLRINERTAHQYGCTVVAAYVDNGRSASKAGTARPGFDRLVADLARGYSDTGQRIAGVVCVADDRLYRRAEDLARFFAALTSRPGRIYVDPQGVRDPYSQEGLLQAVRSLDVAVTETRVRSRRVSDWHWARAVEGVPHSGPRPFGWQEDRITLHPEEAKLVEQAISDRIAGKAVRAIAADWCDLGVTGTRGSRPNAQTVTQERTAPRHLATGFLRCGAQRPDGTMCRGALCAQKGRSKKSPYVYSCRSCGRCSISGPLADEALERLVFSEDRGAAKLPQILRDRWRSGEMGLEEKRKVVASVVTRCIVRPGVKGVPSWDHSRVRPLLEHLGQAGWRHAEPTGP